MNTTYFFDKDELKEFLTLIKDLEEKPPFSGYILKGFVLTPGNDPNVPELHFSPVFSTKEGEISGDAELVLTNTSGKPAGCPYPPGYSISLLHANTQ